MLNFQELNEVPVDEKIWDTTVQMYDNFIAFLPRLGLGLAIIILGTLIATLIGRLTTSSVKLRTKDPLMSRFLGRAIHFTIIIVFIMVALRAAGLGDISAGILATAGASAWY
ncbi:potassium efflux system KefA protein [Nonlabens tegetincola]|uniref:Potassium efflux system KefA protein n=1 Tax=Nonlabens tegetincola TaxID=323273 RepID=A0A090Q389_9FLAO|nr:potassium efflux system KefA protein [Nonlabens tegetincola]